MKKFGGISIAIRFTANSTNSYIWPRATTSEQKVCSHRLRQWWRLLESLPLYLTTPAEMQVILRRHEGIWDHLDNGSDWYISGVPSESWDNDMLHLLDALKGSDFEAVDTSGMIVNMDSGQAAP
jgi:hypothetical protein